MSSSFPDDWTIQTISNISKVGSSKRILQSEYVPDGVPFFRSKEVILRSKRKQIKDTLYIARSRFDELKAKFGAPKANDILVTAVGTIGTIYLIEDIEFYFKDGNLLWIKDLNESVYPQYLAKYMASDVFQISIDRISGGSSQSALTIEKLSQLEFNLPPLPEQQKIAQILTSVDEVIEKIQAQIDKLKDLKTGMMQELLTKGIGHTEFKDSPVGSIPVGWEIFQISELCSDVVDCVNKTAPVVDYKTPFKMIRTTNVRHGRVDTENVRYVDQETYETWTRRMRPENGDLIFTREAPVGECGVLEDSRGVFLGQRTMMYRANEQLTSSRFLMYSLMSNYGKQQLDDFSGGSTVAHMRVPDCNKILIKTPPIEEQNKIVNAIHSIDVSIQKKESKLEKTINTKKALMQDLLTGKVRVNTAQTTTEVAVG
jgi:type I restriction enzyme S subunit